MSEKEREERLKRQYIFFDAVFQITNVLVWGFYMILLYKATGSYLVLALDTLVYYIAMYVGTLWGGILVDKKGYLTAFRIQNALSAISIIFMLLILPQISTLYILSTVIRSIPRGMFWALYSMFYLKENKGHRREEFINIMNSMILIIGIVVPVVAGFMITSTGGYEFVIFTAAVIHLFAALAPWKYNKHPKAEFRLSEAARIVGHPKFKNLGILSILNGANDVVPLLIFGIVPFLFLKSEFEVGIFVSLISIVSAIVLYLDRNDKIKNKIRTGIFGFFLEGLSTLFFVFSWTFPILVIRNLTYTFFGSLGFTAFEEVDFRNRDRILGDLRNESAEEMNWVVETCYLIGRILSMSVFIMMLEYLRLDPVTIVKVFVGMTAFLNLFVLLGQVSLDKKGKLLLQNGEVVEDDSKTVVKPSH